LAAPPAKTRVDLWLGRKGSSRFLKKGCGAPGWPPAQTQKLLLNWSRDLRTPTAQINRSLFASFSSEKEVLQNLW
jgi:hypothetical protein